MRWQQHSIMVRVIPDIHGEPAALCSAIVMAGDRHLILLGDLIDFGPASAAVLELALALIKSGRATLIRSNHDDKLYRALLGHSVQLSENLRKTLHDIDAHHDAASLKTRFLAAYDQAPLWLRLGDYVFAHGAVHALMLEHESPGADLPRSQRDKLQWLALYGEGVMAEGETQPTRTYRWVDQIPAGITAIVGHDVRSTEAPLFVQGLSGGRAVFMDTGCGKGGRLSWIDLPEERGGSVEEDL